MGMDRERLVSLCRGLEIQDIDVLMKQDPRVFQHLGEHMAHIVKGLTEALRVAVATLQEIEEDVKEEPCAHAVSKSDGKCRICSEQVYSPSVDRSCLAQHPSTRPPTKPRPETGHDVFKILGGVPEEMEMTDLTTLTEAMKCLAFCRHQGDMKGDLERAAQCINNILLGGK